MVHVKYPAACSFSAGRPAVRGQVSYTMIVTHPVLWSRVDLLYMQFNMTTATHGHRGMYGQNYDQAGAILSSPANRPIITNVMNRSRLL